MSSKQKQVTHSAGPWHIDWDSEKVFISPPNEDENVICDIIGREKGFGAAIVEEDMANARLIAAAPELLAACKALQSGASARGWGLKIADDAIDAAEGRAK